MYQPIFTVILGVSRENGLEHYMVSNKRFNETMFLEYLDELYVDNKHDKLAVFMDNASSHKTVNVKMKL